MKKIKALLASLFCLTFAAGMMACGGSMVTAKEKGLIRSEGKEYVFKDGDIVVIRFNV